VFCYYFPLVFYFRFCAYKRWYVLKGLFHRSGRSHQNMRLRAGGEGKRRGRSEIAVSAVSLIGILIHLVPTTRFIQKYL
jgi:hypothetical protein